jgi:hypothetical protein
MARDPFDTVCDLIERHVSAEETAPAAVSIVSDLAVLAYTNDAPAPAARSDALRRPKDAATWFNGRPVQVAAPIDDIAAMEPSNRDRPKAVLTAAWADLLAE